MTAASGSATDQPVSAMVAPAASTAPEESASPSTSRYAARMFRLSRAPACSSQRDARLTPSPRAAATMSGAAGTSGGAHRRCQACHRIPSATRQRTTPLTSAARISTR